MVLGDRELAGYFADQAHVGALAGRHANRIANGCFTSDGRTDPAGRWRNTASSPLLDAGFHIVRVAHLSLRYRPKSSFVGTAGAGALTFYSSR